MDTPPELPDDAKQWPGDPFAVLGLPRGAADTDIKRAYNRLLRRFRPEVSPKEFQRLRECYEACLAQSPWYRDHDSGKDTIEFSVSPPEPVPHDPADDLWRTAIAGDLAAAYAGLREMARAQPDRRDLPLRLYWLSAVEPGVDSTRTRHDWLRDALRAGRLGHPAAELYRREIDANAKLVGSPYAELLSFDAEADPLNSLAYVRFAAASRVDDGDSFLRDLKYLVGHRDLLGEERWLGLVAQASVICEWHDWADASDLLATEWKTLGHLQLSHGWQFDRLDEARQLARPLRRLAGTKLIALLPLLRAAAHGGQAEDDKIEAAARAIAMYFDRDDRMLENDIAADQKEALNIAARQFEQYLEPRGGSVAEEALPENVVRAIVRRLKPKMSVDRYSRHRAEVVRSLVEEGVEPHVFAAMLDSEGDQRSRQYGEAMKADAVFRIGWLALRIARG